MDSSSDYPNDNGKSASTDHSRHEEGDDTSTWRRMSLGRPGGGHELVLPSTTSEFTLLISSQLRSNMLFLSIDDATIAKIAGHFEIVQYEPGHVIVEQGYIGESSRGFLRDADCNGIYYYLVLEGECTITKDGKKVEGKYGVIKKGGTFGEMSILFPNTTRTATVVASNQKVVLGRLRDEVIYGLMGDDVMKRLQKSISEIRVVMEYLSGVNTKMKKGTIMHNYVPSSAWLLKHWTGTVFQYVWVRVIVMMALSALFCVIVHFTGLPLSEEKGYAIADMWDGHTRTTRAIQGRFNDISLAMAALGARNESDNRFSEGARTALEDIARIQMLTHILFWCKVVKKYNCILSPEGLSYLHTTGTMNKNEYESMTKVCKEKQGAHFASLTWLTSRIYIAVKRGDINADQAAMTNIHLKITDLRALLLKIFDMYDGRMMFLDPVDNDTKHQKKGIESVGFDIGVLIRETQASSMGFMKCAEFLPQYGC
ncbi:hypothetical protein ACHAW5_004396 [Stephanodiscus triporus]|uniref:Cyclic nucleotide-binding domain-containing protein n=1 Tax=Stephanodiscus triporus TaxID=2934178 RepID=A0ABD3QHM5_9STRA